MVAAAMPTAAQATKEASIVIDANTGKTLHASNADALRYPASLTKMMTLYMVFEAMNAGKISKNTPVTFSRYAASRPPTKLGVKVGGSVPLETAILSLVTRSANDSAAALGELLGGSEENFAKMMTSKARRLGMKSTTFRNASGLPDPRQVTTARDMAVLGMALRAHYPKYYGYFGVRSMAYGKGRIANHNRLLGRVEGVDGIKTGYTRASGFNLVSSVRDGDRKLVAVVMGGSSGRARDAYMERLIKANISKTKGRGNNPLIASREAASSNKVVAALDEEDIGTTEVAVASLLPKANSASMITPVARPDRAVGRTARPQAETPDPIADASVEPDPVSTASISRSGWVIQVGSVGSESEARTLLDKTSDKANRILASASPFTERFVKDGTTYIRARFSGFDSQAEASRTCAALKKRSINCYATQQ
ncbi:MAG: D-alanyl-D-alanine carboxypeptidase family protein [Mesorhizobium sp.]